MSAKGQLQRSAMHLRTLMECLATCIPLKNSCASCYFLIPTHITFLYSYSDITFLSPFCKK